jgi:apolipoprotein N-acyltransferase
LFEVRESADDPHRGRADRHGSEGMTDVSREAMPAMGRWRLAGVAATAVLVALYALGQHAWVLGFVALVPWLVALDAERRTRGVLLSGVLMAFAFVAAALWWFGAAIGAYTGLGATAGTGVLLLLSPLLQPQIIVFALVRHWLGQRLGALLRALGAASAWVATEWLVPRLLGDTLGHGLLPATTLRQVADLGGAAGLTFLLILANEALALAIARGRRRPRSAATALVLATLVVGAMHGYGLMRLHGLQERAAEEVAALRIGMVQANITGYEELRREHGAYAVVRHVLDTHFALSRAALEHHEVDALLWSETIYPTTFGSPRNEDGAALDREITDFVDTLGVPLVFGTYDVDGAGEYNAAAFVEPGGGLLGHYRKTHPFPLTEHVPAWLDGPLLRRVLPWTGGWQPGAGARVFPLRTKDGREVNVVPLICLDDVHPQLAIDGARLGAQAILGLSNDAWFTDYPIGARLHLAVAAFRSIETRMPQIRVTTNGLSAIIDETGEVLVSTSMGDQAVLAGEIPARDPPMTLMVRWGDWVGAAALVLLALLAVLASWRSGAAVGAAAAQDHIHRALEADIVLLTPAWRAAAALLRIAAGLGLLWLALAMLLKDGLQVTSAAQIWLFTAAVVAPLLAAWAIERAFAGRARIEGSSLVLDLRTRRVEIALQGIDRVVAWRLPLPATGVDLHLASGQRWRQSVALPDPAALRRALAAAGAPVATAWNAPFLVDLAAVRAGFATRWFDRPLFKLVVFPLLPALPAFRLHQHIAFGGTFGEYYTFGLQAWLTGLLIWWVSWAIGMTLLAAALRVIIEVATILILALRPADAPGARRTLEWLGRLLYFVGVPAWLLLRILVG